jgi:hypothetical protein
MASVQPHKSSQSYKGSLVKISSAQTTVALATDYMMRFQQPHVFDPPRQKEIEALANFADTSFEGKPMMNKTTVGKLTAKGEDPCCKSGTVFTWAQESKNLPGHGPTLLSKSVYLKFTRGRDQETSSTFLPIDMIKAHQEMRKPTTSEKFSCIFATLVEGSR